MIQKEYISQMARDNAFKNGQLRDVFNLMGESALTQGRGAFFGSIFGTMSHILWCHTLRMSGWCSDVAAPSVPVSEAAPLTADYAHWDAARRHVDGRIRDWAQDLSATDLRGDESWFSDAINQQVTRPMGLCVVHMFNHQTHHRGQISQMLSNAGLKPPVSDLIFLPEDA